jgi:hypothetical protein
VQFSTSTMFLWNIKNLYPITWLYNPEGQSSFATPFSFLPSTSYWGAHSHFPILPPAWLFLKIKNDKKQRNTTSAAKNSSILHTHVMAFFLHMWSIYRISANTSYHDILNRNLLRRISKSVPMQENRTVVVCF